MNDAQSDATVELMSDVHDSNLIRVSSGFLLEASDTPHQTMQIHGLTHSIMFFWKKVHNVKPIGIN